MQQTSTPNFEQLSIASILKQMDPTQQRALVFKLGLADPRKLRKAAKAEIEKASASLGFLDFLEPEEKAILRYSWKFWARPNQIIDTDDPDKVIHLVLAGRGFGKALAHDTPLPTPSGWTTMGDVKVGDQVFDENGKPCRVTAKFSPDQREQYRVKFSDGSFLDACSDHLWVTWRHCDRKAYLRSVHELDRSRPPKDWVNWRPIRKDHRPSTLSKRKTYDSIGPSIRTTKEILDTLKFGKRGDLNHSIPVCAPLDLPEADLPIHPYVLGYWLGDGDSAAAMITTADQEVVDIIEELGVKTEKKGCGGSGKASRYSVGIRPYRRCQKTGRMLSNGSLHSELKALGLLKNKHIPSLYLRASIEQRLALLRGLMDSDGHAKPVNSEFCSTNKALAGGVYELVMSLGQRAAFYVARATLRGRDCGAKYRVIWTPTINPFSLTRKREIVRIDGKSQAHRHHHRMIVSVTPIDPVPMSCITVDSPNSMYLAGKAMIPTHNTRCGAEWVREQCENNGKGYRVALIGPTAGDVRDVMVRGDSGILSVCPPWNMPEYSPTNRRVLWPNGAVAQLYSAEESERLRGPQHHSAWADELCAWKAADDVWNMMLMGMRLGKKPHILVTTTPKPTSLLRSLLEDPTCKVIRGSTYENADNLAPTFLKTIVNRYEGTDLGRQELHAEVLLENKNALWSRGLLSNTRVKPEQAPLEAMVQINVSIDPPATVSEQSDECGLTVQGIDAKGHGHVLADLSARMTPRQWAHTALAAYRDFDADRIVAEVNNGGDMVKHTIRQYSHEGLSGASVPFRAVRATRGKWIRAEPIASLFQQNRAHIVGVLPKLEDQLTSFDPFEGQKSPDRMDAMVWGLTDLMLKGGSRFFI